jgi:hypothetical protein
MRGQDWLAVAWAEELFGWPALWLLMVGCMGWHTSTMAALRWRGGYALED